MEKEIKINIRNKIIEKDNIMDLSKYIENLKHDENTEIKFSIKFFDNTSIYGETKDIFTERVCEEREIKSIRLKYHDYTLKNHLSIYIYNYDVNGFSNIEISSAEENWFFTIKSKIEELLSYCKKQSKISNLLINHFRLSVAVMILISFISAVFTMLFLNNFIKYGIEKIAYFSLLLTIPYTIIYSNLFQKLEGAYPLVEISIKEKNNIARKRRKILGTIFSLIILPIILSFIYDLIKLAVSK